MMLDPRPGWFQRLELDRAVIPRRSCSERLFQKNASMYECLVLALNEPPELQGEYHANLPVWLAHSPRQQFYVVQVSWLGDAPSSNCTCSGWVLPASAGMTVMPLSLRAVRESDRTHGSSAGRPAAVSGAGPCTCARRAAAHKHPVGPVCVEWLSRMLKPQPQMHACATMPVSYGDARHDGRRKTKYAGGWPMTRREYEHLLSIARPRAQQ